MMLLPIMKTLWRVHEAMPPGGGVTPPCGCALFDRHPVRCGWVFFLLVCAASLHESLTTGVPQPLPHEIHSRAQHLRQGKERRVLVDDCIHGRAGDSENALSVKRVQKHE